MDVESVRRALTSVRLPARRIAPISGGWANWTFEVDGEWIIRFPRSDAVAAATQRELALLPELATIMAFAVPVPSHEGRWAGKPFFAYRRIPGRPIDLDRPQQRTLRDVRAMLAALHSFPAARAAELLDAGPASKAWGAHLEMVWSSAEDHALAVIPAELARQVVAEFERFMVGVGDLPTSLVHNDLGPEHVLIDGRTGRLTGVIDFESAWVGDPAVDFTPLWARLAPEARAVLVDGRDLGDRLEERIWFYRWMGSVHAIIHGVTAPDEGEVRAGLTQLALRLQNRP